MTMRDMAERELLRLAGMQRTCPICEAKPGEHCTVGRLLVGHEWLMVGYHGEPMHTERMEER